MTDLVRSSTKKVSSSALQTDARVRREWAEAFSSTLEAATSSFQTGFKNAPGTSETIRPIRHIAPKIAEIERQVERLTAAKAIAEDTRSIDLCIEFLRALASAPVPVPVSGWSKETGPSLFFDQDGYYGDIEVVDNLMEYYLKSRHGDVPLNIFNSEQVDLNSPIPQNLLGYLYIMFARQHGDVL